MRIILKEVIDGDAKVVWEKEFTPMCPDDEESIIREAFDVALCNYIMSQFPEGLGVHSLVCMSKGNGDLERRYFCSGRNVRIKYNSSGMEVEDHSCKDRIYILLVKPNEGE